MAVLAAAKTRSLDEQIDQRAKKAHEVSVNASLQQAVHDLTSVIGAKLVAYIGKVKETRAVREWITGERSPNAATQRKLRLALQIATVLEGGGHAGAIAAWFQGLNPVLRDQRPAEMIRNASEGELSSVGRAILAAAGEFAQS